jgi:lipoprotein-anchoring transpeptidase ErfK/SrfK
MERTAAWKIAAKKGLESLIAPIALAFVMAVASAVAQVPRLPSSADQHRLILVAIPDRKLAVIQDGVVIATFAVAVGAAESPSPTGEFQIINRVANPTYYHPGNVIRSGKDNPVGTRWVGLNRKGYGIHGTNAPESIGQATSHGCIRLRNRDMELLFTMLRVGDVVEIRAERDEQTARIFEDSTGNSIVASAQTAAQAGGQ